MQTLLDVWEGSLDIDEEIIGSGGIIGLIIRLNHMSGGHHKDTNFNAQWLQAVNFLRAPYFVYSPWVDGKANYNWLMGNLPQNDVSLISADIEVRYPEYSSEVYADQVQIFTDLVKAQCHMVIYTGQWFLPTLAHWPTNVEYWWARYPDRFYPTPSEAWSYEKLEVETEKYGWYPDPQKKSPGAVEIWQCSGDRLKLPGCQGRAVDVNLINKTPEETIIWWGADTIPQPPISKLDILWREAYDHPPAGWNLTP